MINLIEFSGILPLCTECMLILVAESYINSSIYATYIVHHVCVYFSFYISIRDAQVEQLECILILDNMRRPNFNVVNSLFS